MVGCLSGNQVKELDSDRLPLPTIESRKSYVDQWEHRRRHYSCTSWAYQPVCALFYLTQHSSLFAWHTPTGDGSAEGFSLLLLLQSPSIESGVKWSEHTLSDFSLPHLLVEA